MTMSTTPRPAPASLWVRLRAVARGLALVVRTAAGLAAAAPVALLSAVCGTPPGWLQRLGRRVADRYRLGYHDAEDAEVIDEEDCR